MATYKEIKGVTVQTKDEDPVENVGSWSSGGSLNTARGQVVGFGVTAAAGAAMGTTGSVVTNYEQYNGTSWTETTDINTAGRNGLGTGTTTAGLIYGGWPRAGKTESWNGSAWTEVGDMTRGANGSQSQAGGGTYTAAFAAGGEPGTTYSQLAEIWDGSSWTEVNDLNTLRQAAQGFGITTNGYVAGGYSPPVGSPYLTDNVEVYNGSSWTETTNINTKRGQGGGAGNATAGIIYGGATPSASALTESWDGSAWTEIADMSTARYQFGKTVNPSSGSTDALAIGGEVPSYVATTEEWAFPPPTAAILTEGSIFLSGGTTLKGFGKAAGIPAATWATGGSLNQTTKNSIQGAGTQTAALSAGGSSGDPAADTKLATAEEYNGTSWTEVNDLNSAKTVCTTTGTQTAAILFGGSPAVAETEHYNGSTWTEVGDLNTGRYEIAAAGGYTAGLAFTGRTPGTTYNSINESWDGTSWTETTDLSTARRGAYGSGSQTAALCSSGSINSAPTYLTPNVESWDGSAWTEIANVNTQRYAGGAAGVQTSTLIIGGYSTPPGDPQVEHYNGTSWTEVNDLSTGRAGGSSLGGSQSSAAAALYAGGTPPNTAITEEFTADATLSTVTVS